MTIYNNNFNLYSVNKDYLTYISQFDNRIPIEHEGDNKRPFIGIVIMLDETLYLLPLTSPKPKHQKMNNTMDFHKIEGGNLGAINFNNMFPIKDINSCCTLLHFDIYANNSASSYSYLLNKQLDWINNSETKDILLSKAVKLRKRYLENKLPAIIRNRCCNFALLEEKCNEYIPK